MNDKQFFVNSGFFCAHHADVSRAYTQNTGLKIINNIFPVIKFLGPKTAATIIS